MNETASLVVQTDSSYLGMNNVWDPTEINSKWFDKWGLIFMTKENFYQVLLYY